MNATWCPATKRLCWAEDRPAEWSDRVDRVTAWGVKLCNLKPGHADDHNFDVPDSHSNRVYFECPDALG